MIIASEKRKNNIAEYLLYMWQIEDIIRANGLDIDKIKDNVISRFQLDDATLKQMTEWYESLIDMMRREDVVDKGHLQMNRNIIGDLADLNRRVLAEPEFVDYHKEFYATLPYIVELRAKSGEAKSGEIETCFNALYNILLLRLRHVEISPETSRAIDQIAKFVALLSKYYYLDEHDKLFKHDDDAS